ncbi:outer membrane protein assembly factor BamB family protein [Cyclobacterium xiamenense]|uniref:outer membrane protein assembly factor BamB family protein n=1 Tax=Cyclobacterium xiamenense TaxID=1297121 RepID=UPI001F5141E6|nr:PQQ-binding-like beta-propeller repeat protein [Cyclobacterium xiamenense]
MNILKMRSFGFWSMAVSVLLSCQTSPSGNQGAGEDWPVYLGSKGSSQYSTLNQINKSTVKGLALAWEYRTGDLGEKGNTQIQCNPLIIDGVLYGTSPRLKAFAVDAATGKERWEFDPNKTFEIGGSVNRGMMFWESGEETRLFYSAGPYLFALDPKNGELIPEFGDGGKVSLNEGLGDWARDRYVISSTPGVIYKNKLILGTRVSENSDAAPGYIRAFDVRTGKIDWVFHTIPKPGEYGHDTWPEGAHESAGGANSWAGMSLDEANGMVYIPTGSAAFDFWGGNRLGENLFANSLIALNAETGERIWHYQTVRHDVWDRDLPAPPNLVTIKKENREIPAVAQITKTGRVFVFDRATGEPIYPIEEVPVPPSSLEGEEVWDSQPLPLVPPPFSRQVFTEEEVTNISPEAEAYVRERIQGLNFGHTFTPPSSEGTVVFPGFDGGGEWGGAAYDQESGRLYVNANEMPWILTMVPTLGANVSLGKSAYVTHCGMCHGPQRDGDPSGAFPSLLEVGERLTKEEIGSIIAKGKGRMPAFQHLKPEIREALVNYLLEPDNIQDSHNRGAESNLSAVPYTTTGYNRFFDQEGYPAVKPPWGTLNAIDLNKGSIAWTVPLGEFPELTARGIPQTGTENYGGPVVTAGGLVFIAASKDEYFRAFDKETGEELWKYKLPAGGYATPAVYAVDGKQYVVIAAGGGKMGTPSGDYYLAFSLNE